jgi:SAM-dependent methyltransferase
MNRVDPGKDFSPIHADYAFFMQHSTEAAADLRGHLPFLAPLAISGKTIRLLDFGCGDGLFSSRLLSEARFDPPRLLLTLVEPDAGYLRQARGLVQPFSTEPPTAWASLPPDRHNFFDLALANHVLYYVDDLTNTVRRILEILTPGGLFLISLAGRENALVHLVDLAFATLGEPQPYHMAEDLEGALTGLRRKFEKHRFDYEMVFPDLEENRLRVLRFLLGEHLIRMDRGEMLKLFDPYARDGQIIIQTHHHQFVIRKDS